MMSSAPVRHRYPARASSVSNVICVILDNHGYQDDLLVVLVQSCRQLGMFLYHNMLAQYDGTAPAALV